ncbi:uncharacterized protein LOC118471490, partial [Tachysurus ichikawai]
MTPRGGPGKLRNHWEDTIHTVVRQVNPDIPVYELRPEKGKTRPRILHRKLLLPCDHLPLETTVQPRSRKRNVEQTEDAEQSEEEDDGDEYYPVSHQQQFELCLPEIMNPECSTPTELERTQAEENTSTEPDRKQGTTNQMENSLESEDSLVEDMSMEEAVPLLVSSDPSSEELQRPRRQQRWPRVFTYDRLGSPTYHNIRALQQQHWMVPWTYIAQSYHFQYFRH